MDTSTIVALAVAINLVVGLAAFTVQRLSRRSRSDDRFDPTARLLATRAATGVAATGRPVQLTPSGAAPSVGSARDHEDPGAPEAPWVRVPDAAEAERAPVRSVSATRPAGFADSPGALELDVDGSTGLDSWAAWTRWLAEEEARVRRFHRPATVVLVELAGLGRLADRIGAESADRLMPPIGMTMRRNARTTDHLARLGPSRFGALLVETDEVRAINYIERIRSACDVWLEAGAVALRLSVGWAEISPDRTAEAAMLDAERRLFAERERSRIRLARLEDDPVELPSLQSSGA
ncbi:MAG TPA: diguanylate cyclase [Candidatus Limnocylindrales bacterium]|nr:diguanylate cyclase [Candidatus Limnocylindrales bacterium]